MDALGRFSATVMGLVLVAPLAVAQSVPTTLDESPQTARSMAMGGGLYGGATSTTAIYANPAGMALSHVYHIDASGLYDGAANRWSAGGAIVDSSRAIAAGLAYNYSGFSDTPNGRHTHDARLALAMPVADWMAIGVTARYMDISGTTTSNGVPGQSFSGFTLDAGVAIKPWRFIQLGVTGMSLTNPDTSVTPLSVATGVAVMPIDTLTFTADAIWDLHSWANPQGRFSGGVEFLAGQVPLRAGYAYDEGRGTQVITGGLGWIDQAFSVEAAIRQEVSGGNQTTLLLNVRYFYRLM